MSLRKVKGTETEFYTIIQNVVDFYYVSLVKLELNFLEFPFLHSFWFIRSMSHIHFVFRRPKRAMRLLVACNIVAAAG